MAKTTIGEEPKSELLTPQEIAKFLKISDRVVLTLLRDGLLKGLKVGKVWRIKKDALDEYMELEIPTGVMSRHSKGVYRDKFYEIIDNIYQDDDWMDLKENRELIKNYSGHMWNCTDFIPNATRDSLGDIIDVVLRDTDRSDKIRRGCTCAQAARVLLDILDIEM